MEVRVQFADARAQVGLRGGDREGRPQDQCAPEHGLWSNDRRWSSYKVLLTQPPESRSTGKGAASPYAQTGFQGSLSLPADWPPARYPRELRFHRLTVKAISSGGYCVARLTLSLSARASWTSLRNAPRSVPKGEPPQRDHRASPRPTQFA